MASKATKSEWRQVGGNQFDADAPTGRHIWVSDGVCGYARLMTEGETVEQAITNFELAGEPADEFRVYQDGERVG